MNGIGAHEVIIVTPDHQQTLATMPVRGIEDVLWAYRDRILDLKKDRRFKYVLIFKNHGDAAGASLEHTHSQLIALPVVPKRVREEVNSAKDYYSYKERYIFCDILRQEMEDKVRLIAENESFVTIAPYAWLERWADAPWRRRGPEYDDLKARFTARLLDVLYQIAPSTRGAVEVAELSTPLSTRHFANFERGEIYGLCCVHYCSRK